MFEMLDKISTVVSLVSMAFSVAIWFKLRNQRTFDEQRIDIRLVIPNTDKWVSLPGKIERKHLTRAEVQGVLGATVIENLRYTIQFIKTAEFYARLENAQDLADQTELLIDCSQEEIEQFDLRNCTVNGF
jgi:hypothetical protein